MRRWVCVLLCMLAVCLAAVPATAAAEGPEIILEPQSPVFPEYGNAAYTVKASGTNLYATWYLEWQGATYNLSDTGNPVEPWEGHAGSMYGAVQEDANTFTFFFSAIEEELNGASIWCVIEDGHYDVVSQKAKICVGSGSEPPIILDIPAKLTVEQGGTAEIRCTAMSPDNAQLFFLWYETSTGRLEDIWAIGRGTEDSDFLFCDTTNVGTRYYVCCVETSDGGRAYSSVVAVTVTEKKVTVAAPEILTDRLPEATVGMGYSTVLSCSDPDAKFSVSYNPGADNAFEQTGLTLDENGRISGTPKAAGRYSFCICAAGLGGEGYMVYTLTVKAAEKETEKPTETTAPETEETEQTEESQPVAQRPETTEASETDKATESPESAEGTEPKQDEQSESGLPWWVMVLIGVGAAGVGVATAVFLTGKRS